MRSERRFLPSKPVGGEGPDVARLVCHALNRGNVLEGPLKDRIADGGNPGCQRQVSTHGRHLTGHLLSFASGWLAPFSRTCEPFRSIRISGANAVQPYSRSSRTARPLPLGLDAKELPRPCIDLGEICRNFLIAATLTGDWMEAAARERLGRACAAKMDYCGKLPIPLRAGHRL
jgi:hypothetical protein